LKYKKIYVEITNSCNFSCSFCYPSERTPRFLAPGKFRAIAREIRPFTSYVYLHVLGEPLLHPAFGEILGIAAEENLRVNITTTELGCKSAKEISFAFLRVK